MVNDKDAEGDRVQRPADVTYMTAEYSLIIHVYCITASYGDSTTRTESESIHLIYLVVWQLQKTHCGDAHACQSDNKIFQVNTAGI